MSSSDGRPDPRVWGSRLTVATWNLRLHLRESNHRLRPGAKLFGAADKNPFETTDIRPQYPSEFTAPFW